MKKDIKYYTIFVLFLLSVLLSIIILFQRTPRKVPQSITKYALKEKIAVIEISGEIFYASNTQSFIRKDVSYIITKLESLAKRSDVKGILIKINSPGGSVAAVQDVYNKILSIKNIYKKPVICYVQELCASGGYYVSCACDKIISAEGSIIGSIGVLLQVGNISDLLKKVGVKVEVIKSSKYKDIGSIYRDMLPEEKQILENIVNAAYEQFVEAVAKGRGLTKEQVLQFADGRIFIATQAKQLFMIDDIGTEDKAIEEIKNLAKIVGDVEIIRETTTPLDIFRQFMSEFIYINKPFSRITDKKFRFEYIFE
ncbi:MAG: signal peptide peptidase SppA [Endomicrobia bacterium]|nr:signal peptide peptidase SppA [Endomicrobiia bacterium]